MKKNIRAVISTVLFILGVLFLFFALLSGYFAVVAFTERLKHGRGLMFADVEFFILITIAFTFGSLLSFFLSQKIVKSE